MTDLRTAAQQALEALEQIRDANVQRLTLTEHYHATIPALRSALAQQEQEPVAWIQSNHLQQAQREPFLCRVEPTQRLPDFVPLYTAPPQRKPLTDQEIDRIRADCVLTPHEYRDRAYGWALHFARAVERAHGITDPQIADRLARHGIPMPDAPTCTDCRGIGYDASGQLCGCQGNPSFG